MREEVLTDEEPLSLLNKPDMITGRGLQAEASDISCQPLRARDVGDAIVAEGRLGKRTCAGLWLGVAARSSSEGLSSQAERFDFDSCVLDRGGGGSTTQKSGVPGQVAAGGRVASGGRPC
jgi:hypothetical protein